MYFTEIAYATASAGTGVYVLTETGWTFFNDWAHANEKPVVEPNTIETWLVAYGSENDWSDWTKLGTTFSREELTFGAPITNPPKNVICVGKNYADHALEMGASVKDVGQFIVFTKAKNALTGPNDVILSHNDVTSNLDYEGEIALIIGKPLYKATEEEAQQSVFGFTLFNDVTARDLQKAHVQFFIGKSLEKASPIGPTIVRATADHWLNGFSIRTYVNGEVRQQSHTSHLLFPFTTILTKLSQTMRLEPGDVIATGTPSGVGHAMNPPQYLKTGDVVRIEVPGIGNLQNRVE
ncbi:MAG: fumarylacetoacetate hydrolase family protein [Bacilli bacterium]